MLTPRSVSAVEVAGSYIIAAGGYNNSGHLNIVEILDMQNQTWKQVASMNKNEIAVVAVR